MAAWRSPSALVIAAVRRPSASVTTARRVRSAFICSCIECMTSGGGSMRWISTRTTRTPHLSVASSRIWRRFEVDRVAAGERLVELHVADEVAQVGLGQLGDGQDEVGDVVDEPLRVGGLVVDDGVDGHDDVVLGDDLLRRHVDDLLAHVDQADVSG